MLLSTDKVLVFEALTVFGVARLIEVVHVELADEARKVVVFEVAWEYILSELVGLVDHEARA